MSGRRDLVRREPRQGLPFPHWLERLVSIGIVAADPQIVRRQRCVNVAAIATAANSVGHLVMNSAHDFHGLLVVNVYCVFMIAASLLVPQLHRVGENAGAVALILLVLFGHMFVVWSFGLSSNLQIYFTLAGAMLFFFGVENWRLFLGFFALYVLGLVVALTFAPVSGLVIPHDDKFRELLSTHAMMNTIIINAAILFYALTSLRGAEVELENQYQRSEGLLTTVMPAPIAERLKSAPEQRIADRIETLSVLFTDLVGFTAAAQDLPPHEVVAFLDSMVREFDALARAHGVEKIKTIGDAYMAAAGFDGPAAEGARAVGLLALDMMDAIGRHAPLGGRKLALRVGIHCGPATAGIIGDTRFSYDVWGNAVNVASRMESHGMPGRIQVTDAYRALTAETFSFEDRGLTEVKGLGSVHTFFLVAAR